MEQQLTDTISSLSELEEVARRLKLDVPETPDPPLALSDFLDEELPSTSGRDEEAQLPPAVSGRQARQRLQSGLGIPQGLQVLHLPSERLADGFASFAKQDRAPIDLGLRLGAQYCSVVPSALAALLQAVNLVWAKSSRLL